MLPYQSVAPLRERAVRTGEWRRAGPRAGEGAAPGRRRRNPANPRLTAVAAANAAPHLRCLRHRAAALQQNQIVSGTHRGH